MSTLPIRVGFNGSCLVGGKAGGWPRYAQSLIDQYQKHFSAEVQLTVFEPLKGVAHTTWEQSLLPTYCEDAGIQILHAPANGGLPWRGRFKKVVTIHDLFSEEDFHWSRHIFRPRDWKSVIRYKLDWWITLKSADLFLTVSDFSKMQLEDAGLRPVRRIYEGGLNDEVVAAQKVKAPERDFLLYVGSNDARKRVNDLVEWFKCSGVSLDLILAGKGLAGYAQMLPGGNRVQVLNSVSEEQLARLYAQCFALITFSRTEGFGLPLVEAMQFGKPVLYTGAGAIPEVVGSGGLRVPVNELSDQIMQLRQNPEEYRRLQKLAREQASHFTWKQCAAETISAYRSLLS